MTSSPHGSVSCRLGWVAIFAGLSAHLPLLHALEENAQSSKDGYIEYPTGAQVAGICYEWSKTEPVDVPKFARLNIKYDRKDLVDPMNGLTSEQALERYISDLHDEIASGYGTNGVRVRLKTRLSPYDPNYGEFVFEKLNPNTTLSYGHHGQNFRIRFKDSDAAYLLPVDIERAKRIEDAIGSGRNVRIELDTTIVGAVPNDHSFCTVNVRIDRYEVWRSHAPWGIATSEAPVEPLVVREFSH